MVTLNMFYLLNTYARTHTHTPPIESYEEQLKMPNVLYFIRDEL